MSGGGPFAALEGEDHASLTTFRRSGEAAPTAVWFALHEGALYARTLAAAGKVKRVLNRADVTVAACRSDGTATGPALDGVARVLADGDPLCAVADALLDKKYGERRRRLTRARAPDVRMVYIEVRPAAPA